jgi:hypothetical protein
MLLKNLLEAVPTQGRHHHVLTCLIPAEWVMLPLSHINIKFGLCDEVDFTKLTMLIDFLASE